MNCVFKPRGVKSWEINDSGVIYGNETILFEEMKSVKLNNTTNTKFFNGVISVKAHNKEYILAFPFAQKAEGEEAVRIMKESYGSPVDKMGLKYDLQGARGRSMKVYEDRCVIVTEVTLGSLFTSNATDGEKTIYYSDCVGVQFKECGITLGYIQLETPSAMMNQSQDNFFNENTFTFNADEAENERMRSVADYIRSRVSDFKNAKNQPTVINQTSSADEILKYKELLDSGIITQEEFDAKKKQLLGI